MSPHHVPQEKLPHSEVWHSGKENRPLDLNPPRRPSAWRPETLVMMAAADPCEPALDVSLEELKIQLEYFSRRLDKKYYNNAMKIYGELKKDGLNPRLAVNTWELFDGAFSFPRVRRYDFVQQHMDMIQHFEDNLNENFTNQQAVENFLHVAR